MNTAIHGLGRIVLALLLGGSASGQVINVEVDYMVESGANAHSHRLQSAEVAAVEQMFACHGLTLNIVVDDALTHWDVIKTDSSSADFFTGNGDAGFEAIKKAHFDHGSGWHYVVMGHNYALGGSTTTSSGLGEIGGDDFVVTLGSFTGGIGTAFDRAATFAHELGHNLGLDHEPLNEALFTDDNSPVYASVMSYAYQLDGVRSGLLGNGLVGDLNLFKELDYSNGRLAPVMEPFLQEEVGVGIARLDWDCDGTIESSSVAQQLDTDNDSDGSWCGEVGFEFMLSDQDDWDLINSSFGGSSDAAAPVSRRISSPCAPPRSDVSLPPGTKAGTAQPTLTTEPCIGAEMFWVSESGALGSSGSGSDPTHLMIVSGLASMGLLESGSILYFQPGTHSSNGDPVVFDTPLFLAGPGGAVISP